MHADIKDNEITVDVLGNSSFLFSEFYANSFLGKLHYHPNYDMVL